MKDADDMITDATAFTEIAEDARAGRACVGTEPTDTAHERVAWALGAWTATPLSMIGPMVDAMTDDKAEELCVRLARLHAEAIAEAIAEAS